MYRSLRWALGGLWLLNGCTSGADAPAADCDGEIGCACYPNGTCDVGLGCNNGRCFAISGESAGESGATGSGGASTGTSGSSGASGGSNNPGGAGGAYNSGGSGSGSGSGGGSSSTGGTHGEGGSGVPLTPTDGWVDGDENSLGIQGDMFASADDASSMGMTEDFTLSNACIKGTATKIDLSCTPVAPYEDCRSMYWGAAIDLNLNQQMDAAAAPFDAATKGVTGFAFEITGETVPTTLHFGVEDADAEYCTTAMTPVKVGANSFTFAELITPCFLTNGEPSSGNGLYRLSWQVATSTSADLPFDFCVTNVRALTE